MAEKTAEQLVALARQWGGNSSQAPWRDGFSDDPADYLTVPFTWLRALNDAQNEILESGYLKCDFRFQMEAGRQEYSADSWLHQTSNVTYQGVPLKRTTSQHLDDVEPGWRGYAPGTPTRYYFISDQIGLVPAPAVSDGIDETEFSLVIRADSIVVDLEARLDQPKRLPARFHNMLAYGAAIRWCIYDSENPASGKKLGWLQKKWDHNLELLKEVIHQRDETQMDQIAPMEYRAVWRP